MSPIIEVLSWTLSTSYDILSPHYDTDKGYRLQVLVSPGISAQPSSLLIYMKSDKSTLETSY